MPGGYRCLLGSKALFGSEKARDEASDSYHRFEYKILDSWTDLGLSAVSKLALRIFTLLDPKVVPTLAKAMDEHEVLGLPVPNVNEQSDQLALLALVGLFIQFLEIHDYFKTNEVTKEDAIKILTR